MDPKPRKEAQLLPPMPLIHPHTLLVPRWLDPPVSPLSPWSPRPSSPVWTLRPPPWSSCVHPGPAVFPQQMSQGALGSISGSCPTHPVRPSHPESRQSPGVFLSLCSLRHRVSVTLRGTGCSSFSCPPILIPSTRWHFRMDCPGHTSLFFPPKHHLFFKSFESVSCSVTSDSLRPHGL